MNTISLRLYPETEALYRRLMDECDAGSNGKPPTQDQFINLLLENYQNPRKQNPELAKKLADQEQTILQLQTELGRNADSHAKVTELEHKLFVFESENAILKEAAQVPAPEPDPLCIPFEVTEAQLEEVKKFREDLEGRQIHLSMTDALYVFIRDRKISR